jgi:hypothetical protein
MSSEEMLNKFCYSQKKKKEKTHHTHTHPHKSNKKQRASAVAQGVGPEFKPQYCKKIQPTKQKNPTKPKL